MNHRQREALSSWWQGTIGWDVAMAGYCTLRAGGKADAFIDVHSPGQLSSLLQWLDQEHIPWFVLGRGSNVLVADEGYPGVILRLKGEFADIALLPSGKSGSALVQVGAACTLPRLVSWCADQGLAGVEFLEGIPGTVGGAVRMNAGAWGHDMEECLQHLHGVDDQGKQQSITATEIGFSYRRISWLQGSMEKLVIIAARLRVQRDATAAIQNRCKNYQQLRRSRQPKGVASAGSFFKNPPGDSAGRLIEAAGLKTSRKGGAVVSPVHANFIVNDGHATAADILSLMQCVQEKVYQQFQIHLEPEVQILGGQKR